MPYWEVFDIKMGPFEHVKRDMIEDKSQDGEDENKDKASKGKKSEDVNGDNDLLKGAAGTRRPC